MANEAVNEFQKIPVFRNFNDLTDDRHYRQLPVDWWVIVADIAGSTQAIEAGRYKDVNTIGAACIVAAQNAMERAEFPYVFGGDGTTLLVPPDRFDAVASALDAVRSMAATNFQMRLRVGAIRIGDLGPDDGVIEVARFSEHDELKVRDRNIFEERCTAMFRGGGIAAAEDHIKAEPERYEVPSDPANEGNLSGLTCRWKPVPSINGTVLSLLVLARTQTAQSTYAEVLRELDAILDGDIATANPIHVATMGYRSFRELLRDEVRMYKSWWSWDFMKNVAEIVYAIAVFHYHLPAVFFDATRYAAALDTHSDFRKFDDLLRMVVDCTPGQATRIQSLLKSRYDSGQIFYGTHRSDDALMTCFVYGMSDGEHIHFVDGGDGGYAMAAREFKAQMKLAKAADGGASGTTA